MGRQEIILEKALHLFWNFLRPETINHLKCSMFISVVELGSLWLSKIFLRREMNYFKIPK